MISFRKFIKLQLIVASLTGSWLLFLPSAQAQNTPEEETVSDSTTNYFLDNFKCSLNMMGRTGTLNDLGGTQGGVSFGYYLYKYNHTQKGIFRGGPRSGKKVLVNAGKGLVSLETGISYAKNYLSELGESLKIEERLIIVPITLQLALPDYFYNGIYDIFFLRYNVKGLLGSYEYPNKPHKGSTSIPLKNGDRFFHSFSGGFGLLTPFGLYGDVSLDFPLNLPNNLSSYTGKKGFFSKKIKDPSFCFSLGFDITMLLRKLYGISFQEGPLISDSPYISP